MRTRRVVVACLALLAGTGLHTSAQAPGGVGNVSSRTLENGLQVIVVRNPTVPFVTLEMVFRAGAFIQQEPGDAGLAHLIEHMLFRRGDAGSYDAEMAKLDAISNGVTDAESVRYFFILPSKNLAGGVDLMSRMVRKPAFTKGALESERGIVRGELERRASEPDFLLLAESERLMWGDQAWTTKNPGGNVIALNEATPERLKAIYDRFYLPNNAALIVAGDVTDTAAFTLATNVFKGWKRGADPVATLKPAEIKPLTAIGRKMVSAEVKDVTILVRWHGPSVRKDPGATYAADVFAGLVNQEISQTQRRLVDAGLVDELSLSYQTLDNVGPIELVARTSIDRGVAATQALGAEIARLVRSDFFDAEDLALAKKWQRVAARHRFESSQAATSLLSAFWSSASIEYFNGYEGQLEAQTPEDVRRFVGTFIAGKPMTVVMMVPQSVPAPQRVSLERALGAWKVP